ncbi:MAG: formylglycine-generating enzyme family protein [Chloroflexales bacterium]|nr:formylglycine-generating enzyme family protein [Chloroflexales bacterium]
MLAIEQLPKDEQRYLHDTNNTVLITVAAFALARYLVTNAQYQ